MKVLLSLALVLSGCIPAKKNSPPVFNFPAPTGTIPPLPDETPGFLDLARIEDTMLLDAQNLGSQQERENTRYLVGCDRTNQKQDVIEYEKGLNIAMNRLSNERFTYRVTPIGQQGCIFRINLENYSLTKSEWRLVEDNVLLPFVSRTTRNENLQFLVQARKPYLIGSDFTVTAYEGDSLADKNGRIYYDLVDQDLNTTVFLADQGVDLQLEVDDENLLVAGVSGTISLGKGRLVQIAESNDGYCMLSYDTALGNPDDIRTSPFTLELARAGGVVNTDKIFDFDASEIICAQPNGLFSNFRLSNKDDHAEVVAPTDIVINSDNQNDVSIRIATCSKCHFSEMAINVQDTLAQHIRGNPAFDADEKRLGQIFYNSDRMSAILADINRRNDDALKGIGIDTSGTIDPFTFSVVEPFRSEMDASAVAALTYLPTEEFLERLRGSALSSQALGSLLNGGKVSLAVLSANFVVMVDELALYQDQEL